MTPGELTQALECPVCGWENGLLDSVGGLHAIQRQCGNTRCKVSFLAVYRGDELVDAQRLIGHELRSYRRTLSLVDELSDAEVQILVAQAAQRAERMPFQNGTSG